LARVLAVARWVSAVLIRTPPIVLTGSAPAPVGARTVVIWYVLVPDRDGGLQQGTSPRLIS
jgi:hypothetical protein